MATVLAFASSSSALCGLLQAAPILQACSPNKLHFRRCAIHARAKATLRLSASSSSITIPDVPQDVKEVEEVKAGGVGLLACPICLKPLQSEGRSSVKRFKCESCKKVYAGNDSYLDLTITAGLKNYEELVQPSTEVFRNPLVSYVYERGYRQAFQIFGYPGPDEELKLANKYLESAAGGVLVDVSCASGVSTRRFIKSGLYSSVIGLDFSESMLEQFQGFVQQDPSLKKQNLILVRADVARLPFATGTIDAVHAGAAIHCWPSPSNAVAEISRILKPGGVFVATTNAVDVITPVRQAIRRAYGGSGIWAERELEELCKSCGLVNWSRIRRAAFIMFSAQKPS
eukprot:c17470_g1_i1 orf=234-1262(-)